MQARDEVSFSKKKMEECDVLFYQGIGGSQTQALKYVGDQQIVATTGELMWCVGRNNLPPLNVIYRLHIGTEIADVNLKPFSTYTSFFNPINLIAAACTGIQNRINGFKFAKADNVTAESVVFHAPILSEISIGQETDIKSHKIKYDNWLSKKNKTEHMILWGVSRGTATTFCAFTKYKYPEVKLVILEGAIDTIPDVLPKRILKTVRSEFISGKVMNAINSTFSFFEKRKIFQYSHNGISPMQCVDEFPEGIPVVFITSKKDEVVPWENTQRIAEALNAKGKNEVYLLKLEKSSHPSYMFDDKEDHNKYECFIHAIYQKYDLKHEPELAEKGRSLLEDALLEKPYNLQMQMKY